MSAVSFFYLSALSWQVMLSTSTTPSNCSCRQPIVVAMKQPVRPIPALGAQEREHWSHFETFIRTFDFPPFIPAVDNNWACGSRRPSVCLHVGHELQQWHRRVGGFVVGPRRVPVMLQHAGLIPTLRTRAHRILHPTKLCRKHNYRSIEKCVYLECEAASGVVLALSDAVHQHLNLPIDSPLLRPIQNTLLQRGTGGKSFKFQSSCFFKSFHLVLIFLRKIDSHNRYIMLEYVDVMCRPIKMPKNTT